MEDLAVFIALNHSGSFRMYFVKFKKINKYVIYRLRVSPYGKKTVTSALKMLPEAYGLGQHFQDLGHSFSPYRPPSWQKHIYMYLFYTYFLHNAYITLTCTTYNTYITIQVHLSNRITVDLFMLLLACCSSY